MLRFPLLTALLLVAPVASAEAAPAQDGLIVSALDPSVPPCENFFLHACNGWIKANPIPADQAHWGLTEALHEENLGKLRAILEQAAAQPAPPTQKIGAYWSACIDEAGIEAKGLAPLQPELDRIAAVTDKAQLAPLVGHLQRMGVDALFGFGSDQDFRDATQVIAEIDQGGLGLPERKYYVDTGKAADDTRAAYIAHLARMLALSGTAEPDQAAAAVMAFETRLAQASMTDVERRDPTKIYHKLPVGELDRLAPGFQWTAFLKDVGAPKVEALNIAVPGFFGALQTTLQDTPLDTIKLYLRARLLHHAADMLPKAFVEENFRFYGKTLAGTKEQKPRWKRCVAATDLALGEDLGRIYVQKYFGPDAKAAIEALIQQLRKAYAEDIQTLPWMGQETKAKALAKLDAMAEKIGYPAKWRDYSKLEVKPDDALGNRFRADRFENDRQLDKIGKPVDKGEWVMTPPTVNAYYDSQKNDINFPAGILQPPFFDAAWDDAINYGSTGATIGHEMTHGFDDEGRQFDLEGNLKDWWTKEDGKKFTERTSCLVKEYGGFSVGDGVHLDGKLTLGENTADNGGTRIAYRALKQAIAGKSVPLIDGYTPEQRFFLAYAQSWCGDIRPEAAKLQALSDPHSTAQYRVNGVVANMPEFREAFQCAAGTALAPKQMCRVW